MGRSNLNYLVGPGLTVAATAAYHGLISLGAPLTVAALYPLVVAAAYISGLRAGLVAAAWVGGYSAWLLWAVDPWRVLAIGLSLIVTNVMVGILKRRSRVAEETRRKAEILDGLNGNLARLNKLERRLADLLAGWNVLESEARRREVVHAHSQIAALVTVSEGWRELWRERTTLIEEHEKRR